MSATLSSCRCARGLDVTSRTPIAGGEDLIARMSVGYKQINETFTTSVQLRPSALAVDANYLDGPFKRLENRWRFIDRWRRRVRH